MGFIMDGLDGEAYDRKYGDGVLVKRIISYFRPQTKRMLAVSAAIIATSLVNTGLPIFISDGLDKLQVDDSTRTLIYLAVGIIGSLLAGLAITNAAQNAAPTAWKI